jgi:hypothetical protein
MDKEFKRMMELAGLDEIKVISPAPLFKTNDQLAEYLEINSNYKKRLIDAIFSSPEFNRADDPSWEDVRRRWLENPATQFVGLFTDGDELMIDDGEDNRIYISVTPLNGDPTAFASFEVNLPPNKFYCEYY